MKVKPDIGQILSKAAVLLDSLVTPHPAAVDSEQTNQSSLAQLGHEEEEQVIHLAVADSKIVTKHWGVALAS